MQYNDRETVNRVYAILDQHFGTERPASKLMEAAELIVGVVKNPARPLLPCRHPNQGLCGNSFTSKDDFRETINSIL